MDRKHTPGPWRSSTQGFAQKPAIVAHVDRKPVSVAVFEKRADRDIALAAPDMLEALKGLYETGAPEGLALTADELQLRFEAARAVISKATGGQ